MKVLSREMRMVISRFKMENAHITFRRAKATDIKSVIKLLGELGRPLPKGKSEDKKFRQLLKNYIRSDSIKENRDIILALSGSKIIGLISFVLLERLNQISRELWIPDLIVSQEYRTQGIGKLLIQKCESIAKRKKCYRIRLESRIDRIESRRFYKNLRFLQIARVFEKKL